MTDSVGKPNAAHPTILRSYEELHRRAGWRTLSDQARALELAKIPRGEQAPSPGVTPYGERNDPAFQAWLTELAGEVFQPKAVAAIRTWLAEAPWDAHLFVVGPPSRGRLGIVATLARQVMAKMPAPPDYCYVPDPAALNRQMLLALPAGTGGAFVDVLRASIEHVLDHYWTKAGIKAEVNSNTPGDGLTPFDQATSWLRAVGVADALPYTSALQSSLQRMLDLPARPTIAEAGIVAQLPDFGPGGPMTAPVVFGFQTHDDLPRALLRARGGVLILAAQEAARMWETLSSILRVGKLALRGTGLEVPLPLRVVIIGTQGHYLTLDKDNLFRAIFRYKAVFEAQVEWTARSEAAYASLAREVAADRRLPALDASGIAYLVEEGARRAQQRHRTHLTTDLAILSDLVIETGQHVLASQPQGNTGRIAALRMATGVDMAAVVMRRHQQLAWDRRNELEVMTSRYHLLPTDGAEIGAITGVGVSLERLNEEISTSLVRHSVTISPGDEERLIDIEHEARAADPSHVMGELTMIGYLAWKYGQQHPLSLRARLRGEERYGAAGPSASAAELFMTLSALACVPIFRSFAVTGVAGQHGEIQHIGGVTHKIEGFWELCKARWDAGERPAHGFGMLIPAANAQDLMLRPEIAEQIARDGWFAVYPISTIDDGLPILMGFPKDQIQIFHEKVRRRLDEFYQVTNRGRA